MNIPKKGSAWRLLNAVVLLSLVLVLLPAPALARPATSAQGPVSAPSPQAAPQEAALREPTEPPADCLDPSRPASAQHLLPYPEQEVGATYKVGSDRQEYIYYDYSAGALTNRALGPANHISGTFDWGRGVAVDINGDSEDEIVEAGRGEGNRLTVQAFKYGGTGSIGSQWWAFDASLTGDQVKWIDIAAGNLLRHSDGTRDVVVATRNNDGDLQLLMFRGTGGYNLSVPVGYKDAVDGRENVWHTAVATGDLTGEGFDDNIVTAFKDGGGHLQVLVMRYINNAWQKLAVTRFVDPDTSHGAENVCHDGDYTNNSPTRGIDVTTGDVDGDGLDEAIVAFVDNNNHFQVMSLGLSLATSGNTPYVLNDEGYYYTEEDTKDPEYVGVAAPDLNGDGIVEILAAFGGRHDCCSGDAPAQVWRLSYGDWTDDPNDSHDQGTSLKRDLVWKDQAAYDANEYDNPTSVTIEKVNVDAGQRDRAILAFNTGRSGNDSIELRVLQEPGDAKSLTIAASANYDTGAGGNYDVTAIAGDINRDSHWLTYTGVCKQYGISAVDTVLNMPPIWYEKNAPLWDIGSALGQTVGSSSARGETTTAKYGASYTIDGSVSVADIIEAGPKFKVEFEGSHGVEKEEKYEISTTTKNSVDFESISTSGLVLQDTVNYRVYVYKDDITGKPVRVRVPAGTSPFPDSVEKWKTRQAYRGWLPVGPGPRVNLALGKAAAQSSTYYYSDASRAVDGNTDGNWYHTSVSHTNSQAGAWWQVDLSSGESVPTEKPIETVSIWNRTDAVPERLQNYVVKVYDKNGALTWTSPTQTGIAGMPTMVPVHRTGRTVRIQLLGTNYLSLAEVQVWKELGVNLALNKPATQSSTYQSAAASRAVDGNTDGNFNDGSVSSTDAEAGAWWQVDLGEEYPIGEVDIWNRTDCCSDRLTNFTVKVSNTGTDWEDPPWQFMWHDVAGRPTAVKVGTLGHYVRIQLAGTNYLSLAEVQVLKGREVPDYPKALFRDSSLYFTVTNWDGTTERVAGNLKWDWCNGYMDPDATASDTDPTKIKDLVAPQAAVKVYSQSAKVDWETAQAFENTKTWKDTWGIMFSAGFEAKAMGVGAEWDVSGGFEKEYTNSLSQKKETYFEGSAATYTGWSDAVYRYEYCPYYYVASTTAADGVMQAYTVLDYYVPCYANHCTWTPASEATSAKSKIPVRGPVMLPQAQPGTPVIESSTHPDPDTWYNASKATFTWHQPAGDPVTNPSYNWLLDQQPDTVPEPTAQGTKQTDTYYDLADGAWYLHVRVMGPDGQWSDTAHRRIRIDGHAPEVKLALDPPAPSGNQGWYTVPVTVTASATDPGSGVAALEISTDGTTWQSYAGPLHFTSDTPATTIRARASDAVGHASEPVSATLKVDLTPPDSKGLAGCDPGGVCAGGIYERTSRIAGMEIKIDGGSWTSVSALGAWEQAPGGPPTPWAYAALLDVGNGHHIIYGRAADGAGHLEAAHKIKEVTWFPAAPPDLSQSSIAIEPATARPGAVVTVTLVVRNGGFEEAYVATKAKLPAGLAPAEGALATLDHSITYDPATGVITWPVELLWPGEHLQFQFQAVVAGGLAPSTLTARLDAHGSWPNIDLLSPDEQKKFRDYEDDVTASAALKVDPQLPAGRDVTAPRVRLTIRDGNRSAPTKVDLALSADADARLMYVREWTLDPASGAWTIARSSGWQPYEPSLLWTLSDGGGVKYLGAWVADAARNVSRLDEGSLAFTNRLIEDNLLAAQRRQYRFAFDEGLEVFNLLTTSGQADLYAWLPGQGGSPAYTAEGSDYLKALGIPIVLEGLYQLETVAGQDTAYTLIYATPPKDASAASATNGARQAAAPPERPLTMTTPLTAGAGAAPELVLKPVYLPIIFR